MMIFNIDKKNPKRVFVLSTLLRVEKIQELYCSLLSYFGKMTFAIVKNVT